MSASLGWLIAVAENYPDRKANTNFAHLQERVSGLENQIADRREFYNDSVNTLNIRIQEMPDAIVAAGCILFRARCSWSPKQTKRSSRSPFPTFHLRRNRVGQEFVD